MDVLFLGEAMHHLEVRWLDIRSHRRLMELRESNQHLWATLNYSYVFMVVEEI